MNVNNRSTQPELLDEENIPSTDLARNLKELNVINTWLGGHRITVKGVKEVIGSLQEITICEIGCGGGDNLLAINKWAKTQQIKINLVGIDLKPDCIAFAKNKTGLPNATWIISDYREVLFDVKPHIIFSSLFCHHFSNEELVAQLNWMKNNCTTAFFINDLHRHVLAYYFIKLFTRLFSKSYLVKNDAPLSVARGFTAHEWKKIFTTAHMHNYSITWQWAFRHLIIFRHD